MTTDAQLTPTDDEIHAVVQACRERGLREFDVFRTVLAKLGTQPQAGAVPLTDEQKNAMWVAATIELPSPQNCYLRGMADAEHAHGIKGGQHGTESST